MRFTAEQTRIVGKRILSAVPGPEAFLVPCEWGAKKSLVTHVERPFGGTKTPAYRALFDSEPRDIAVYLGRASGGLCAIDFDANEDLAAFWAALVLPASLGLAELARGLRAYRNQPERRSERLSA